MIPGGYGRATANYGRGVHTVDMRNAPLDGSEIRAHLAELFSSPNYMPPSLPEVAIELLTLTRKPDIRLADLAHVIRRDPLLAGRVLRIARGAPYGGARP